MREYSVAMIIENGKVSAFARRGGVEVGDLGMMEALREEEGAGSSRRRLPILVLISMVHK
jgi:hypothetical protein